jgi:hypothetical protein
VDEGGNDFFPEAKFPGEPVSKTELIVYIFDAISSV